MDNSNNNINKINYTEGHLYCGNCIYDDNCEEINDRCVANYILENKIVHLTETEKHGCGKD